jgi:hypothetical protein
VPDIATTLHNLGILYAVTHRLKEAEATFQECLRSWRELAKTDPRAYGDKLAKTLFALALTVAKSDTDTNRRCVLLKEANKVAVSEQVRGLALKDEEVACKGKTQ